MKDNLIARGNTLAQPSTMILWTFYAETAQLAMSSLNTISFKDLALLTIHDRPIVKLDDLTS